MAKLILVRHGKTDWNHLGKWTGHAEADLIEEGIQEAKKAAQALRGMVIHHAFVADLRRAQQTFIEICRALEAEIPHTVHAAIKERDYGQYTGKNKWEVQKEIGEEAFQKLRRGWDVPVPGGETLKDVHDRIVPYYETVIKPKLTEGKHVLLVSSGNALRALAKYLEEMSEHDVAHLEIGTGEVHAYTMDESGGVKGKELLASNPNKGKV